MQSLSVVRKVQSHRYNQNRSGVWAEARPHVEFEITKAFKLNNLLSLCCAKALAIEVTITGRKHYI